MIDSLLTLTRAEAAWLTAALFLAVLANRAVTLMTGNEDPIFLVLAVVILVGLIVTSVYTGAKWIWHLIRGRAHLA